jgi:hypothetical protein
MTRLPCRDHPEPVTATVPICLHGASGTSPEGDHRHDRAVRPVHDS